MLRLECNSTCQDYFCASLHKLSIFSYIKKTTAQTRIYSWRHKTSSALAIKLHNCLAIYHHRFLSYKILIRCRHRCNFFWPKATSSCVCVTTLQLDNWERFAQKQRRPLPIIRVLVSAQKVLCELRWNRGEKSGGNVGRRYIRVLFL